jgi:5'-3' exonuclease
MGIDNFYTWYKQKYPNTLLRDKKHVYDFIYVDVNHLLHNSISGIKNISSFKYKLFDYLDYIFHNYIATKKIILAVDGSSPYSKVLLQRKRRLAIVRKINIDKPNSLHLTVGTSLMNKVNNYLNEYIKLLEKKYKFINIAFDVSDTNEHDEGEIKIFRRLIENHNNYPNSSHLVIGNDADLVVLAMAVRPVTNIYLLIKHSKRYDIIAIDRLIRNHYIKIHGRQEPNINYKLVNLRSNYIRDDFCIISIMSGNDYLPKLSYTKFYTLWKSYQQTYDIIDDTLIGNEGYNIRFLKEFMIILNNNLALQFRKFKLDKYNEDMIQNYLEGLLWCLDMYRTGKCNKYDYLYRYKTSPSPVSILYYLLFNDNVKLQYPISKTPPLSIRS